MPPARIALGLSALVALAGCGGSAEPARGATRLLRDRVGDPVISPRLVATGAGLAGVLWDLREGDGPRAAEELAPKEGTGRVLASDAALVLDLDVEPGRAYRLRLEGRPLSGTPQVLVTPTRKGLPEDRDPGRPPPGLGLLLGEPLLEESWGAEGVVEAVFRPPESVSRVLLSLSCEAGASLALESLRLDEELPREPTRHRVGEETRRAVPVAVGEALELEVPPAPPGSLLELGLALPEWAASPGGPARVRCRTPEGDEVFEVPTGEPRTWRDLSLPPGNPLEVTLEGPAGCVVLVSEPLLLAPREEAEPPNLILVSVDTLRADRLGCYGFERPTSPEIDARATAALLFDRAYSPSNFTLPAHASLMTAQPPAVHGARRMQDRVSIRDWPSLARALAAEGYLCAAFTGGGFLDAAFGFDAGFDRYGMLDPLMSPVSLRRERHPRRHEEEYNKALHDTVDLDTVLRWIEDHRTRRFFLFLHTYHVHNYCPSPAEARRFEPEPVSDLGYNALQKIGARKDGVRAGSAELRHLENYYAATVRDVDAAVGRVFETLERLELERNTVVVLLSDHGEAFREHGTLFHSNGLWEEVLRVPLLVWIPGQKGRRVGTPASLTDLAPTLLELLGTPPLAGRGGRLEDPAPVTAEDTSPPDSIHRALIGPRLKLQLWPRADGPATTLLFDLLADPGERSDLSAAMPEEVRNTRRLLETRIAAEEARARDGDAAGAAANLDEDLRELGYLDR